ncbi:unnamed protein product [Durusdinium trenchii]|uniref:Kinesin light chain n=1 Tax=Durusdinium trenchii TaxID=1381693 RepID=A0ABP0LII7_9DINO
MASPDELDAASVASPHASPEHRDGAREATEPCVVCGGPTVLCCSGGREIPAFKQEIVLAGREHAIKGAEEKREQLRAAAVAASRDRRYMDVLDSAMQAYQMGSAESRRRTAGEPDVDLNQLVELLLLARATHVAGEHASGLKYLDHLAKMVDSLTGADGNLPIFHPCSAATLLLCTAELCLLFGQQERATDYSRAYLAMARLAHGEGSPAAGDAYGFHAALLTRRGSLEEALHHTMMMLQVRQRCGSEKSVADAHWNIGVLLRELHQYTSALESLESSREIYSRCSGEGLETSQTESRRSIEGGRPASGRGEPRGSMGVPSDLVQRMELEVQKAR